MNWIVTPILFLNSGGKKKDNKKKGKKKDKEKCIIGVYSCQCVGGRSFNCNNLKF